MTTRAAVGVDDDFAAGEAGVAHGTAHHEAAGGIHIDPGAVPRDARPIEHGRDDVLQHILFDNAHVLDLGGVLRRDHDRLHRDGAVVLIAHGHLGLAVRAQIRKRSVVANCRQALCQAARQIVRHGHEGRGLVGGVPEHHALVAGSD